MKRITNNSLIVLSFLGALFFYSCNDKDNFDETDTDSILKELQIKIESKTKEDFPSTRVITDSDTIVDEVRIRKSHFEKGDAIGVFAVEAGQDISTTPSDNYINNGKVVFNGTDWVWQPGTKSYYPPGKAFNLDFYAYYPYTGDKDTPANALPFGSDLDLLQSYIDGNNQDRQANDGINSNKVGFEFKHLLAMVQVDLENSDLMSNSSIIIEEVKAGGTLDLRDGTLDVDDTTPYTTTSAQMINDRGYFRAYLPPDQDLFVFTIKHNGERYEYELPTAPNFEKGKFYEYLITPKKANETIQSWPNSYVVKTGDVLFIPVGKPYNVWNSNSNNIINTTTLSKNQEAELLWMDEKSLIKNAQNISIKKHADGEQYNAIKIQTNNKTGNAVVALKIDGTIVWSWHVWVIDKKPGEQYYGPSNETFLDRNLGATSNEIGNAKAVGLYYQWGRKDPFPGYNDWGIALTDLTKMYNAANEEITPDFSNLKSAWGPVNVDYTLNNPDVFIKIQDKNYFDWIAGAPKLNLWYEKVKDDKDDKDNKLKKSVYDPCPQGWKVPAWKDNNSPWVDFSDAGNTWGNYNPPFQPSNKGAELSSIYFPYAGYRNGNPYYEGVLSDLTTAGSYWTSATIEAIADKGEIVKAGRTLYFTKDGVNPSAYSYKVNALPVRCVKEK